MNGLGPLSGLDGRNGEDAYRVLIDFALPSEPGNERRAMELVAAAAQGLELPSARLEKLKTAVAEATMNAMEHGNAYRPDAPVTVRVLVSAEALVVAIGDRGSGSVPDPGAAAPDLEAKLQGRQTPRGWGLFLIQHMVDELHVTADDAHHTVELVMYLHEKGDGDAGGTA